MAAVLKFTFSFRGTIVDINGVEKDFGKTEAHDVVASIINLPEGAVYRRWRDRRQTAGVSPTVYTASLGDSSSATRYASAVDLKTAARTALTLGLPHQREPASDHQLDGRRSFGNGLRFACSTLPNRANEVVPELSNI